MKKMMGKEEEQQQEQGGGGRDLNVGNHTSSSCLATLQIKFDDELESISEYEKVFEMCASSLRDLHIDYCGNLTRISRGLEHLTALENLYIVHNSQLKFSEYDDNEEIMAWKPLHQSLHSLTFQVLESMTSLPKGMQYLTSLQTLNLVHCTKLKGLPEWISSLSSLQSLTIYSCNAMESLPEGIQTLTSLQTLTIYCPDGLLKERSREPDGQDWPKIQHIPNLRIIPGSSSLPISVSEFHNEDITSNSGSSSVEFNYQAIADYCSPLDDAHVEDTVKTNTLEFNYQAITEYCSPLDDAHVEESFETNKLGASTSSPGFLNRQCYPKMHRLWAILALVLIARTKIRARVRETHQVLKELMLTCCLFPDKYEIRRDALVHLWMAGGFLNSVQLEDVVYERMGRHQGSLITQMEDVGNCCFDLFERRKIILASSIDKLTGKMKYVIRHKSIESILKKLPTTTPNNLYTMLEDDNPPDGSVQPLHVSVVSDHIDQTTFLLLRKFCKLKTLLFLPSHGFSFKQIPSTFFPAVRSLQVLDLSGSRITELPTSIGYVTQLRYLDLSFTLVERLPESISCLHELQTLKLLECNYLFDLPKGMSNLINLRHLDFDVLGQLTSMPRGIGALTEIRTLSAFIVDNEEGCNIGELKNLNNLTGSICICGLDNLCLKDDVAESALWKKNRLSQLQLRWNIYGLKPIGSQQDLLACIEHLIPHTCLEDLQLLYYPFSQFPTWMGKEMFEKLVSISLVRCENSELNVSLGRLPKLKYLEIAQMNEVTNIDSCFRGETNVPAFQELETLLIDGMSNLETWRGIETCDFPCLLTFIIKWCPKLIELHFLSSVSNLKHLEISRCRMLKSLSEQRLSNSLETLIIDYCPLLKKKCSKDGEDWNKIKDVPNIWIDLKNIHDESDDDSTTKDSLSDDLVIKREETGEFFPTMEDIQLLTF